ncbi:hypothetical protein BDD12DRAFT_913535 [Trichophaea hybrida]|nr:hypothetical protein BDD12DRAFT_913535 [Trichophaea hybrida]
MNPTSLFRFILAFFLIATVAAAPLSSVDLQVQGSEKRGIEKRDIMTCAICLASHVVMGARKDAAYAICVASGRCSWAIIPDALKSPYLNDVFVRANQQPWIYHP